MKAFNIGILTTGVGSNLASAVVATGVFLLAATGTSAQAGTASQNAKKIPVYPLVLPTKVQAANGTIRDHRIKPKEVRDHRVTVRDHRQPVIPQPAGNPYHGGF
jgi:hypothetical protein